VSSTTRNIRVPGIPGHYQEAAREANLAFDQKMKQLRSSMGISKEYLESTQRGPTAQDSLIFNSERQQYR
jgi:hypothetical protein